MLLWGTTCDGDLGKYDLEKTGDSVTSLELNNVTNIRLSEIRKKSDSLVDKWVQLFSDLTTLHMWCYLVSMKSRIPCLLWSPWGVLARNRHRMLWSSSKLFWNGVPDRMNRFSRRIRWHGSQMRWTGKSKKNKNLRNSGGLASLPCSNVNVGGSSKEGKNN